MNMEKTLFEYLVQSLKEAKSISKGRSKASRRIEVVPTDAKAVRENSRTVSK
jgi:putative transcriptional regulator